MLSSRRALLITALAAPMVRAQPAEPATRVLRDGGVVAVFRHALAPGTYDPPGMKLGDCSTQRNLSDEGRAQAGRMGEWFRARGLKPAAVRSSPWCRCLDTARLAFGGTADNWALLGSPQGRDDAARAAQGQALRQALAAIPPGRFEAWVTHNFVIAGLTGISTDSAEGLVLRLDGGGTVQVLARIPVT